MFYHLASSNGFILLRRLVILDTFMRLDGFQQDIGNSYAAGGPVPRLTLPKFKYNSITEHKGI